MTGIGLLYRVHGEGADGVDAELIDIARIFDVFRLIGNFWQGYGKSHSLKQPPTDKPTLNWGHLGSAEMLFERCWRKKLRKIGQKPKNLPRSLDLYAKTQNLTADNTDDTDFHGLKPQRGIVPKMRITC
jgi:hypothetical protein